MKTFCNTAPPNVRYDCGIYTSTVVMLVNIYMYVCMYVLHARLDLGLERPLSKYNLGPFITYVHPCVYIYIF